MNGFGPLRGGRGTGGGPPPGLDPNNESVPLPTREDIERQGGGGMGPGDPRDPGFQPRMDPLAPGRAANPKAIYRDIPLVTVNNCWQVCDVRNALGGHMMGIFEQSGQLADSMIGDDRVQATLNSLMSALFGREVRHRPPTSKRVRGSRAAREVEDAWVEHWPQLASSWYFWEAHTYGTIMGWSDGQIDWDTTDTIWKPYPRFWHPRYEYYHWYLRKYVALTQDGAKVVFPGDGKWIHHTPKGDYRGWVWGALRAIAEPWLIRHFALRDMARYSERHGMPIIKAFTPAASEQAQRDRFEQQVSQLGTETAVLLGRGVDANDGYDLDLLEATSSNYEVHPGLMDRCDMHIQLALIFQNLSTEVKGGSFAATSAHMDVLQFGIEMANSGWRSTIHSQIYRPFAFFNFGDAELAGYTDWNVSRQDDYDKKAARFYSFGQSIQILRQGGIAFKQGEEDKLRGWVEQQFDIKLPDVVEITEPDAGTTGADAQEAKQAGGPTSGNKPPQK